MVDPDGRNPVFIAMAIGATIGATSGGIIAHNNDIDWWKGAITGGFIGAGIGSMIAVPLYPSAIATGVGTPQVAATTSWGITSSIVNGANVNMAMAYSSGANGGDLWKFGITGAASGAFNITGGFGMVKKGFWGRLGYQGLATAGSSVGNNWAAGRDLFSKYTIGVGPVNFTFGKNQRLLQAENNIGNIAINALGIGNKFFGKGEWGFDKNHLTPYYTGGTIKSINGRGFGAFSVINEAPGTNYWKHELHHLWTSRAFNNSFFPNFILQMYYALSIGHDSKGRANYQERIAYGKNPWKL